MINGDISGVRQAVPHDGTCVGEDGRGRDHGGQAAQQGRGGQHHEYRHHRHDHYRHQYIIIIINNNIRHLPKALQQDRLEHHHLLLLHLLQVEGQAFFISLFHRLQYFSRG